MCVCGVSVSDRLGVGGVSVSDRLGVCVCGGGGGGGVCE